MATTLRPSARPVARKQRVDWNPKEEASVIDIAATLHIDNPNWSWTYLLGQAQNAAVLSEELAANRLKSNSSLSSTGKARYAKKIKERVQQILEARMADNMVSSIKRENAVNDETAPTPAADGPLIIDAGSAESKAMMDSLDKYTDSLAAQFKMSLMRKFVRATNEAHNEAAAMLQTMTLPSLGNMLNVGGQEVKMIDIKPTKVALVGDSTDENYFLKVQSDLGQDFQFIRVKTLSDIRHAAGCDFVVSTGSGSKAIQTAMEAVASKATFLRGKSSADVNGTLQKHWNETYARIS